MTLQDTAGAVAAGLALGLVLAAAWTPWSPSDMAPVTVDTVPHVAAPMPEAAAPALPGKLEPGCGVPGVRGQSDPAHGFPSLPHSAYCPISGH